MPDLTISKVAWAVKGRSARRMVDYLKGVNEASGVGDGIAVAHPAHPNTLLHPVREPIDQPHYRNWRYKIWQQGAGYDFNVYTLHKCAEKVAYIHANPVRAGLVSYPEEYSWSSAVNYATGINGPGAPEAIAGVGVVGVAEGIAFGYPYPRHPVRITFYSEVPG